MRRPAFQFYPADWRNNANLRRCSWSARGVWIEVIGLMHDSDEYGILRWTLREIAQALGCPVALVKELSSKGVMKGADVGPCGDFIYTPRSGRVNGTPVPLVCGQSGPIWYSSRMVKDEHLRSIRGDSSRFGAPDGAPPNESPMGAIGATQSDGSTSTSTPTGKPTPSLSEQTNGGGASLPPAKPSATTKGARLPKGWVLPKSWGDWALGLRKDWTADAVRAVADKFHDHWVAQPGQKGVKLDWEATWRNWVRNEPAPKGQVVDFPGQAKAPDVCCVCGQPWSHKVGNAFYCSLHDQYSAPPQAGVA